MHNRSDRSVLVRHSSPALPTHLVVVNLDARLQHPLETMAAFLPHVGVTLFHVHREEDATVRIDDINEAQMLRMLPDLASFELEDPSPWARAAYRYVRPAILHALRLAFKGWSDDAHQERTVLVFVGAPRTPLEAALLGELPLDVEAMFLRRTGMLPLVLRLLVAPQRPSGVEADVAVARVLSDLEQTYFALPDTPAAFEANAWHDTPTSSAFDTTVWIDADDGTDTVVPFLRTILRLHGDENARFAHERPSPKRDSAPSFDEAAQAASEARSIDWLSLCDAEHAPRLWLDGLGVLTALLDFDAVPDRRTSPLADIRRRERETNWRDVPAAAAFLSLVERPLAPHDDLLRSDFPYRITDEDRPSKLELARHLSDLGAFERAAEVSSELLVDEPGHRLLHRMLGANLYVAGQRERGGEILRNCIAMTEVDASLGEAERADEIATLHHLMGDYDAAISGYERAIEAEPLNAHAYQGLVLILRARGDGALADHWLQSARRRDLELPLLAEAERLDEPFAVPVEAMPAERGTTGQLRERRSRWWSFLRR